MFNLILEVTTNILLVMVLGWYLITNLQWYNYKIERVILKHHKVRWHITYFITPIVLYYLLDSLYYAIYFYALYMTTFILWNKKLDKALVMTGRVKRFLAILMFVTLAVNALCLASENCDVVGIIVPLVVAYAVSFALEKIFFISYKNQAKKRLETIPNLKIIAITASFGKTSIKNYLYQVLNKKYRCYMTPRSVNTIAGLVLDVNRDLPKEAQVYIAEAGARAKGDIEEITHFLSPQYAIIGSVGEQHIEYFKTLDNIIHTKMEILQSPRLKKGFVHTSVPILDYDTITKFPDNLNITMSNLDGIWFDVEIHGQVEHFHAPILGSFNAINLTAVILCAVELGMSVEEIKIALHSIKPVDHRLKKMEAGGKIILDDSFNGNLEGMLEAVKIASTHHGRKVIVTPGIVESTQEANIQLAQEIDQVFDLVMVTGSLNYETFKGTITKANMIYLEDKSKMEEALSIHTKSGDLILFANDAPNFI